MSRTGILPINDKLLHQSSASSCLKLHVYPSYVVIPVTPTTMLQASARSIAKICVQKYQSTFYFLPGVCWPKGYYYCLLKLFIQSKHYYYSKKADKYTPSGIFVQLHFTKSRKCFLLCASKNKSGFESENHSRTMPAWDRCTVNEKVKNKQNCAKLEYDHLTTKNSCMSHTCSVFTVPFFFPPSFTGIRFEQGNSTGKWKKK